jgi:hypothetical protein
MWARPAGSITDLSAKSPLRLIRIALAIRNGNRRTGQVVTGPGLRKPPA